MSSKLDYHSPINVSFRWPHPSLLPVTKTGFVFSLLWAVSKSSAPSISALGPSLSSSLSLTRLAYRLPNRLTLKTTLPPFSFSLLHRSTSRGIGSRPTQPSRLKISPPPPKSRGRGSASFRASLRVPSDKENPEYYTAWKCNLTLELDLFGTVIKAGRLVVFNSPPALGPPRPEERRYQRQKGLQRRNHHYFTRPQSQSALGRQCSTTVLPVAKE